MDTGCPGPRADQVTTVKNGKQGFALLLAALVLGGCVTMPMMGPSVMVLPTPGKPFDLFMAEDDACRYWAQRRVGRISQDVANQNTANAEAVGAIAGAAIGAAIGSSSGNAGEGAILGAGSGLLLGGPRALN